MSGGAGFTLSPGPNEGDEGMALRDFYVTLREGVLKRLLIYVNTAYHLLAVLTTFCHQIGHHMSTEMLGADEHLGAFFH
jgi:hypothetical protein